MQELSKQQLSSEIPIIAFHFQLNCLPHFFQQGLTLSFARFRMFVIIISMV